MANYANTVLLNALANLADPNKDLRAPQYGATRAFNDYKRDLIVNYDEFNLVKNKSDLQTKQVDYLRRTTATVGSSRAASLTGSMGDSTRDTLTWVTYTREFTISDDNMRNNTQAFRMLSTQMRNARLDIGAEIESDAVTKLEAFKNTVQGNRDLGTWDSTNYVSEIANANKNDYYNYMATEMRTLDYNGPLQEIHTYNLNALINQQTAQGQANSANLQFQYPDFQFYTSNSVTNLSDYFGTSYVCEQGSLGLIDWIPGKNREGLPGHNNFDFTQMPDPFGIFDRMALAIEKKVQDSSAAGANIGGNTQDAVWLYEVSIDVAFFIPTITTQKLVNKYGLLSS
jgi:hypothetical protein